MARLASVEKAQYYPTQEEIIPLILDHLTISGHAMESGVIFDPCCGEGRAIEQLRDLIHKRESAARNWKIIGVELEGERAKEAKERLDCCIHAPLEQVGRVSGKADIVFNNPPYDQVRSKRAEPRFVVLAAPYLNKTGGVMIIIVPETLVGEGPYASQMRKALREAGLTNCKVFRYPEPTYRQFKQVVIFAKKAGSSYYEQVSLEIEGTLGDIPPKKESSSPYGSYDYERQKKLVGVSRYSSDPLTITHRFTDEVAESAFVEGDYSSLYHLVGDPHNGTAEKLRPLMPMKDTHAAMVAAAGLLNGLKLFIDKKREVVICSKSYKRRVEAEKTEISSTGKKIQVKIEAEEMCVRMRLLDLATGEIETVDSFDNKERFEEMLLKHAHTFVKYAHERFPPLWTPDTLEKWRPKIEVARAPKALNGHENGLFEPQKVCVSGTLECWRYEKCAIKVGEMSTGKTLQSLTASAVEAQRRRPGNRVIVVVVPPKSDLVEKWKDEAKQSLRMFENPDGSFGPKVYDGGSIADVDAAFAEQGLTVLIIKETSTKLSSGWERIPLDTRDCLEFKYKVRTEPTTLDKFHEARKVELEDGQYEWRVYEKYTIVVCPECGEDPRDEDGKIVDSHGKTTGKPICRKCGGPLWQDTRRTNKKKAERLSGTEKALIEKSWWDFGECLKAQIRAGKMTTGQAWAIIHKRQGIKGYAKYPIAKYIRDRYHARYVLIVDEAHKAKGGDTAIGYALMDLISSAHRVLIMTGTIFGGLASSIFYILYRTSQRFRNLYSLHDVQKFVDAYGLWQKITKFYPQYSGSTFSGYKEYGGSPSERPGVAPGMAVWLLQVSTFITLEDLKFEMPDYAEHTYFVDADDELLTKTIKFLDEAASHASSEAEGGNHSPLGEYRMARLGTWDIPTQLDAVDTVKRQPLDVPIGGLFAKEEAFLRLVQYEQGRDRKVLAFVSQINARDCTGRYLKLLREYGMKGEVLRASEKKRIAFIRRALRQGADVVFCSPDLVDTGIDLEMFQTAVWLGVHFSMYVVPQANRRLYRLTQTGNVDIYYIAYNETPQAIAFDRIAKKMAAQQAIQGDVRKGLASLMGEVDFVSRLQDTVTSCKRLDSDVDMDDFPPLVKPDQNAAYVIDLSDAGLAKPVFDEVEVEKGVSQASFF